MIRWAGLLTLASLALVACDQQAFEVGVANLCGYPIEVSASSSAGDLAWQRLEDPEPTAVRGVAIEVRDLHLSTRFDDLDEAHHFILPVDDLAQVNGGDLRGYGVFVSIQGNLCPGRLGD